MKILLRCRCYSEAYKDIQPAYYLHQLKIALDSSGHKTNVWSEPSPVLASQEPQRTTRSFKPRGSSDGLLKEIRSLKPDLIIWSTDISDFFCKPRFDELGLPVVPVLSYQRLGASELLSLKGDIPTQAALLGPILSKRRVAKVLSQKSIRGVVFQSSVARSQFLQPSFSGSPVLVLPPPMPERVSALFLQEPAEAAPPVPGLISYYGPLSEIGGIDILLEAFAKLRSTGAPLRLQVVAAPHWAQHTSHKGRLLQKVQKLGLEEAVVYCPPTSSFEEAMATLRRAQVICMPFRGVTSEAPILIQEAQALGTPLITTPVTGIEDIQDSQSILLDSNNPSSLSRLITQQLSRSGDNKREPTNMLQAETFRRWFVEWFSTNCC